MTWEMLFVLIAGEDSLTEGKKIKTMEEIKKLAAMVGCNLERAQVESGHSGYDFCETILLDHIFTMVHDPNERVPHTPWEKLPPEIQDWYQKHNEENVKKMEGG